MATKEELFAAVRLISKHCALNGLDCSDCPLLHWCNITDEEVVAATVPEDWPDPEEGGGEDGIF